MVKNRVLKITERVLRKHAVGAHRRYGSADEPQAGTNPRMGPVSADHGGVSLEMISTSALGGEIAEAPGRPHVGAGLGRGLWEADARKNACRPKRLAVPEF